MNLFGTGRQQPKAFPRGVAGVLCAVIALSVWQVVALVVNAPYIVPGPVDVVVRAGELVVTAEFWEAVAWSLLRVLVGLTCGFVLGVALAFGAAAAPRARAVFAPFVKVLRTVPVVCFILLMLLWVNATWLSAIVSALMVLPVAWTNTVDALDSLDAGIVEMAQLFELPWHVRLFRVYMPAIAPQLVSTLVVALGLAWKSGVTAEALALPFAGMGTEIYQAKIALDAADIFVWAAVIVAISWALETVVRLGARRFADRDA